MSENRVIGRDNRMPWSLPPDRKRFHAITRGHPVIVGRKTFESIGRPLSARTNIVLTRRQDYWFEGCVIVHDLASALAACGPAEEVFILGGEEVFRETLPLVDRIYLTVIHRSFSGDAYFPEIPPSLAEVHRRDFEEVFSHSLILYERTAGRKPALPPSICS